MMRRDALMPRVRCERSYTVGEVVRLCRFRDGRRVTFATVRSYDAARDVLGLVFASGDSSDVSGTWRAVTRAHRAPELPVDALRVVASYLSAKRVLRVASVSSAWLRGACLDGSSGHGRATWRRRVLARWPGYPGAIEAQADWRACYSTRLRAERSLQKRCIKDKRFRNARNFTPRLCANPACLVELESRRTALAHHATHPFSWRHLEQDDVAWLQTEVKKLNKKRKAADRLRDDPNLKYNKRDDAKRNASDLTARWHSAKDILRGPLATARRRSREARSGPPLAHEGR